MAQEQTAPSTDSLGATSRESVSLPDSVEGHDAAEMWKNLGLSDEPGAEPQQQDQSTGPRPPEGLEEGTDVDPAPDDDGGEQQQDEEGEDTAPLPELADAPEFWSEEDRQHWLTAPPELREIVKRMEKQRIEAVNEKTREASEKVRTATEGAKQLLDLVQNSAQWWQQNGAALQQGLQGKWAHVDWNDLSANNPAEFTRLKFLKEQDDATLAQAQAQGQRDMQITQQRQQAELADMKRASHEVLARDMPQYFAADKYEATYTKLGEFLMKQGFAPERINRIAEAPLIRMAMESMLYRESKAKASGVVSTTTTRDTKTGQFTVRTAPTRVQPGPGRTPGNRQTELDRQAMDKFRKSRGQDISLAQQVFNNLK